jgi:hypothetical protein
MHGAPSLGQGTLPRRQIRRPSAAPACKCHASSIAGAGCCARWQADGYQHAVNPCVAPEAPLSRWRRTCRPDWIQQAVLPMSQSPVAMPVHQLRRSHALTAPIRSGWHDRRPSTCPSAQGTCRAIASRRVVDWHGCRRGSGDGWALLGTREPAEPGPGTRSLDGTPRKAEQHRHATRRLLSELSSWQAVLQCCYPF